MPALQHVAALSGFEVRKYVIQKSTAAPWRGPLQVPSRRHGHIPPTAANPADADLLKAGVVQASLSTVAISSSSKLPAVTDSLIEGLVSRLQQLQVQQQLCLEVAHSTADTPTQQLTLGKARNMLRLLSAWYTEWAALFDVAEGMASLLRGFDEQLLCYQLCGSIIELEQDLAADAAVPTVLRHSMTALLQQKQPLPDHSMHNTGISNTTQPAAAGNNTVFHQTDQQGDALLLLFSRWCEHRVRLEGFHPVDSSAYSVILSRDEKLQGWQALLQDEGAILQKIADILYRSHDSDPDLRDCYSPVVDVDAAELAADPILAHLARTQGWGGDSSLGMPSGTLTSTTINTEASASERAAVPGVPAQGTWEVRLTLQATMYLLQHHPDAKLREQVYEMGLEARGVELLRDIAQLCRIRQLCARMYGQPYATLNHWCSIFSSNASVLQFLSTLQAALQPAALRLVDSAVLAQVHGGVSSRQLQACDLAYYTACVYDHARVSADKSATHAAQQVQTQPLTLQLPSLLAGVSQLLKQVMGVWLQPITAQQHPSQAAGQQQPAPSQQQGAGEVQSVHSMLHEFIMDFVTDPSHRMAPSAAAAARISELQADSSSLLGFSVHHEDWGVVGTLVVHPSIGQGARPLLGEGHPTAAGRPSSISPSQEVSVNQQVQFGTPAGYAAGIGPVVLVGLQTPPATATQHEAMAYRLRELLHELGHALHMVLSWHAAVHHIASASHKTADESGVECSQRSGTAMVDSRVTEPPEQHQQTLPCISAVTRLPVELAELPSTLLELLVTQVPAVAVVLEAAAAQQATTPAAAEETGSITVVTDSMAWQQHAEAVVAVVKRVWYNPLELRHQILVCMMLQQLCEDSSRLHTNSALDAWQQLCSTLLAPQLATEQHLLLTGLQLQCLQRTLQLRGASAAYLAAWAAAAASWTHHGLVQAPCDGQAWRQLRRLVYEQDTVCILNKGPAWLDEVTGNNASKAPPATRPDHVLPVPIAAHLLHFCEPPAQRL